MEEKSEGYNHYSTNGGSVTGVVGYIFLFIFKFNTRLTFVEGAETGCGLASTDVGSVTGVAGSLGCSSCKEIKKQEQWLPKIVPKCLRKHTK